MCLGFSSDSRKINSVISAKFQSAKQNKSEKNSLCRIKENLSRTNTRRSRTSVTQAKGTIAHLYMSSLRGGGRMHQLNLACHGKESHSSPKGIKKAMPSQAIFLRNFLCFASIILPRESDRKRKTRRVFGWVGCKLHKVEERAPIMGDLQVFRGDGF